MANWLVALILGIVEGLTEFLPVSSTGHLILANIWFNFEDKQFTKLFDIVVQVGAILAVIIFFWNKIMPFGKPPEVRNAIFERWINVGISVIPALLFGKLLDDWLEENLFNPKTVAISLVLWGIVLLFADRKNTATKKIQSIDSIHWQIALYIGLIQCLAMIPGTSRSAATIVGAMLLGCTRVVAADFSFLLAIPTLCAASGYKLLKFLSEGATLNTEQILSLSIGFVTAFVVAWFVISKFMAFISTQRFTPFAWYRIGLGIVVLILLFAKVI